MLRDRAVRRGREPGVAADGEQGAGRLSPLLGGRQGEGRRSRAGRRPSTTSSGRTRAPVWASRARAKNRTPPVDARERRSSSAATGGQHPDQEQRAGDRPPGRRAGGRRGRCRPSTKPARWRRATKASTATRRRRPARRRSAAAAVRASAIRRAVRLAGHPAGVGTTRGDDAQDRAGRGTATTSTGTTQPQLTPPASRPAASRPTAGADRRDERPPRRTARPRCRAATPRARAPGTPSPARRRTRSWAASTSTSSAPASSPTSRTWAWPRAVATCARPSASTPSSRLSHEIFAAGQAGGGLQRHDRLGQRRRASPRAARRAAG